MRRKGFTLVEVLIVVIILGILAAIGIPQLNKAVERSRGAEAKVGFGLIRTTEGEYYAAHDEYAAGVDQAAIETNLGIDLSARHWSWSLVGGSTWQATATRTGVGPWAGQTFIMNSDGTVDAASTWDFAQ